MASMPRSGREPCAARPSIVTVAQTKPRWAMVGSRWLGSVTMAASARKRSTTCSVPKLAYSSSATQATMMSPASPAIAARSAATIIAATPPFMS